MSQLRQDMVSKEWVIIATERAKRPDQFRQAATPREPLPAHSPDCPFCLGNEGRTPPPLLVYPDDGSWRVRVVPNKFAALNSDDLCMHTFSGKFLQVGGYGSAEVVIETPRHDASPGQLPVANLELVLKAYRTRYLELEKDSRNTLITIFRNHGARAGTSLAHPHSQIIATPVVPPHVRNEILQGVRSFDTYGSCLICLMMEEERAGASRMVVETEHFAAFCPFASRSPFETRIVPRRHESSFAGITPEETADLAVVLRTVLGKIHRGLNDPDYNFVIRCHPLESRENRDYHWQLVILPKLATAAGFEIGTGIYINPTAPEECAAFLRDTEPSEVCG